jgi:hypothetical protein
MAKKPSVYKYTCEARSNFPDTIGSWGIELEDEAEFLYYSNLANDYVALVFAKLGQEFSKYRLDNDLSRLKTSLEDVEKALRGSVLD